MGGRGSLWRVGGDLAGSYKYRMSAEEMRDDHGTGGIIAKGRGEPAGPEQSGLRFLWILEANTYFLNGTYVFVMAFFF